MTTTFSKGDRVVHTLGRVGTITRGTETGIGASQTVSVRFDDGGWRASVVLPRYLQKLDEGNRETQR
jgi:preprotein translocase subunit YajC